MGMKAYDVYLHAAHRTSSLNICQGVHCERMPYPAQTDAEQIRSAALALLTTYGEDGVTIRGVAKRLGLTPNALYRYYRDHDALLAELASMGAGQLLEQLKAAARDKRGREAIYAIADAYATFAAANEALYKLFMRKHALTPEQAQVFGALWTFVRSEVAVVSSNPEVVAVSLWGLLHGMVGLEQAEVFHDDKPNVGVRPGVRALLSGLGS